MPVCGSAVFRAEDVREFPGVDSVVLSVSEFNAGVRFVPVWLNISHVLLSG